MSRVLKPKMEPKWLPKLSLGLPKPSPKAIAFFIDFFRNLGSGWNPPGLRQYGRGVVKGISVGPPPRAVFSNPHIPLPSVQYSQYRTLRTGLSEQYSQEYTLPLAAWWPRRGRRIQYNAYQCSVMRCHAMHARQCNEVQCNAIQCNAMRYL